MTIANQITIFRILLIPVFVSLAVYYGQSVQEGTPQEWLRLAAIAVFVIASASDGLDGFVARRFNQRSRLGAILDPLADKGLLLAAIITLSVTNWPLKFPLWFPILVVTRDVVILVGCMLLRHYESRFDVRPTLLGKAATAAQMVAVAWVMLQLPHHLYPIWVAGLLTLASGLGYVWTGSRRLQHHDLESNS